MFARTCLVLFLVSPLAAFAGDDAEGCQDPALFTRMPGFWIYRCDQSSAFDARTFIVDSTNREEKVEGKVTELVYYEGEGRPKVSGLQIVRNYEAAAKRLGARLLSTYDDGGVQYSTLVLVKDGKEVWIRVSSGGERYSLVLVEREAMVQEVVANAAALKQGLEASGHVEVPGILFETGKATLKPESDAALGECAKLLQASPKLAIYVVGHTDNQGPLASNMTLSTARADAVVKALVTRFKVSGARLAPFGAGPYAPVASNAAEAGRAKNRRVELVAR